MKHTCSLDNSTSKNASTQAVTNVERNTVIAYAYLVGLEYLMFGLKGNLNGACSILVAEVCVGARFSCGVYGGSKNL